MSYLTKQNIADIYPLSPMQQGMLFHTLYDQDSPAYFEQFYCIIEGELVYKHIEKAWNHLIDEHPVFRTVFNYKELSQPVQIVLKKRPITIGVHDFKDYSSDEQKKKIEEFMEADRSERFDLSKGPLLRINIFELANGKIFFLWSYHHILLDGWCLGLILVDFFTSYLSLKDNKSLPRFSRPPFKNYIAWLNKQDKEKPKAFWTELLKGFSATTPLPWDFTPKDRKLEADKIEIRLNRETTKKIEEFARMQRITLSTLLQAAWGVLLGKYSGYDDVVFGATVSGRPATLSGADQMVGIFINSLPLRIRLSGIVGDMLRNLQEQSSKAQEYGYSFLPDVKAASQVPIKDSLFDSLVVFENYPIDPKLLTATEGIKVSEISGFELTNFDLCLVVAPGEEMGLSLTYMIDRFRPETIERMLRHLSNILISISDNPHIQVSKIEMLDDMERDLLLKGFNDTSMPFPEHKCIQEFIEEAADKYPERIAVTSYNNSLTYKELDERSNSLAHYLKEKGIGPGETAGIFIERSIDMIVAVLGIIKAGGAYVPLETEYPKARLEYMLFDSDAGIILTHSSLNERLPLYNGGIINLDVSRQEISSRPKTRPPLVNKSTDLVYLIYTSGSTGNPKGIQIEHRGLVNYILWALDYYKAYDHGSFPLYTSMSFDLTVTSMFVPLIAGEHINIMQPGLDPTTLVEKVITSESDIAKLTPAHLEIADKLTASGVKMNPKLKRMILGGEALSAKTSRSMQERYPGLIIDNEYGPAETVVGCIVYTFENLPEGSTSVPIGKPIANTIIYLLDKDMGLVPVGVPGEIYISSPGVARGYLNNDDVTARSFLPNPFIEGDIIYRTGDLGRWRSDGIMEYLGRVDYQIKIRGYRIELGEIESALLKHPSIHDCVVTDKNRSGDRYIAGYYVSETEIDTSGLKDFLRNFLPEYMVPSYFMRLESLPLSPNGKIDRNALPEIDAEQSGISTEYIAPRNDVEEKIAAIFRDILGISKIGVFDNFFELGGHSLKATQAVFKIRKELGIDMPLRTIFDEPTIDQIARAVGLSSGLRPIEMLPVAPNYPLSQAQQRLWFLDRLIPNSSSYNIHGDVLLEGKLNVDAVTQALQLIIDRHESLRTTFSVQDDIPVQLIIREWKVILPVEDVNESELDNILNTESSRPFKLDTGPLFRLRLLRLNQEKHILMLTMHHIISDGWSIGILMREAAAAYSAIVGSRKPELLDLRVQYKDFAAWQNSLLEDGSLKEQEKYWLDRLKYPLPMLDLPTDRPRPPIQTTVGSTFRFKGDSELNKKIRELLNERDITLNMLLLSAYATMLNKLSNQEDIIIGSPIAGRNHPDLENIIGFFVNMIALRLDFSQDISASELIKQVKQVCLDAYSNQEYPFNRIIDIINPTRDTSRSPIFNTMFVLQNASETVTEARVGNLLFKDITKDLGIAKFDLTLYAFEASDSIDYFFEYNTDLFNTETVQRFAGYFSNILRQIVLETEKPLSSYEVMGKEEEKLVIEVFNNTDIDYPNEKCVYQFFEEQAERTPDRIAVTFAEQSLTYKELNKKTNQLARYLREFGVKAETMVALMVERSIEMEIALIGIIKSGGAYVPIGTEYPEARIDYIIEDTNTPVVLTQKKFAEKFAGRDIKVVCLDSEWPDIATKDTANLDAVSGPDNLAYVLYTSGSTGIPKGVACIHKGLTNRLIWMQDAYGLGEEDIVLQKTPYTFDVSGWEFHWPMMYGARLHFLRPGGEKDPLHILEVINERKVTTLHFVPSMLGVFLQVLDDENSKTLRSLRRVICSGEALMGYHRDLFFKYLKCELHNLYGPTEASIDVTWYECKQQDTSSTVPIGKPIANTRIYILDKNMSPVPVGVAGEVYLAGIQLARGYVNKPEKTAESFIPFSIYKDTRLYKTGDLGRWMPDGNIDYLGRIDHQVKIRGNRIELGEVESVFSKYEGIHDCVVIDYDDPTGKYLVGYYVSNSEIPVGELRTYMIKALPEYMVPTRFMWLEDLPLSPNGKVDRKSLPRVENVRSDTAGEYIEPRNDTERAIAEIFKAVLVVDKVGIKDNFFDLGGHSLRATQVISRIKKELGIDIPLRVIFETPTIEGLAGAAFSDSGVGTIPKLPNAPSYPLSHAQKRLWFLDQMIPGSSAYNMPLPFIIEGALDEDIMRRSLQGIVDRHETLRTTFINTETGPAQVVAEKHDIVLRVEDASQLEEKDLLELASEEAMTPFDLAAGPLFRTRIFKMAGGKFLFILTLHHIISDGWSLEILINELIESYAAYLSGKEPEFEGLKIQYRDYASWQSKLLKDGLLNSQEDYWKTKLGGDLPVVDLPADRARSAVATTNGALHALTLDSKTTASLKEMAKKQDVTLYMLILAILDSFLARVTGNEDIIVGSAIAGRNNHDLEGLIGFFINSLALRTDISGDPSFDDLLSRVKQTCIEAYANQDYPFDRLIDKLGVVRDTSRTPVFTIMLVMQDVSSLIKSGDNDGMKISPVEGLLKQSKFDLTLFAIDTGETLELRFEYNTDLFDSTTMKRYAGHIMNLLEDVIVDPSKHISELNLLSREETDEVVFTFNDTVLDYPRDVSLVSLLEETALRLHDHPAVQFEDSFLTYSELNCRANKLSRALTKSGVERGSLVGLMAGTPIETIIGILGILKSGGAYMPIDSEFPENRIGFMLDDSCTPVVVTMSALASRLPKSQKTICLDSDWADIDKLSGDDPKMKIGADDIAYAIYTSGSTGKPKGSLIPHRGVVNLVFGLKEILYSYYEGPLNVAQLASFSFDASVQQIFASLLLGNTLFPVPASMKRDMGQLIPYILNKQIDVIDGTPSLWEMLVANGIMNEPSLKLKHIIIGGEALPVSLYEAYRAGDYGKATRWTNVYGVTESSVDSTFFMADVTKLSGRINVPIGAPIVNTWIYILDKSMNPVPIGVPGEIYIGGDGLAKGYLNNPERTAVNFIPDPFRAGNTVYKTGDLGKWLPDGNIDFLGRIDFQVKIRGFRIELGEIETALSAYEGISDCVVIDRSDGFGGKYLAGYYIADREIPVGDFRSYLSASLPDYMVPARFMRLNEMPMNTSGKIDRRALPEPDAFRPDMAAEYVEPRNEIEKALADVWKEVLRLDRVGIFDNFFDLGGDSIISLQVVSRLKKVGYEIKPRHMFECQTIATIAPVVEKVRMITAQQGDITGNAPLTPVQRWFFEQGFEDENFFNQTFVLSSVVRVDEVAIRGALNAVIEHHDALRTRFDRLSQEFLPTGENSNFIFKEVSDRDELVREVNKLQTSLDIKTAHVFAAGVFRHGECDYIALTAHHLVVDGVSWRILFEDLFKAYGDILSGAKVRLPEKTSSFKDWSERIIQYSPGVKDESNWWKKLLSEGFSFIPVDHNLGINDMESTRSITVTLEDKKTEQLIKTAHKAYNTEINDLLLTALMRAINKWTDSSKVTFDLEGHGREDLFDDIDITRTAGWFTTIFPVVLNVGKDKLSDQIKHVKESLRAIPNKGFNYGVLKYILGEDFPVNSGVSFNYMGQIGTGMSGLPVKFAELGLKMTHSSNVRPNLIDVICIVSEGKFRADFIYSINIHKKETIEHLADSFIKEIDNVLVHCMDPASFDITPADFGLDMAQEELDQIYG
jgi:amino acid adenylation domain-containing protein/non-ribosomal peptide synthase protein (TIGR01720 family)